MRGELQRKVLEAIAAGASTINEVARAGQLDFRSVQTVMTRMRKLGYVTGVVKTVLMKTHGTNPRHQHKVLCDLTVTELGLKYMEGKPCDTKINLRLTA